ncbi:hypothetical protein DY000_02001708 [Brassica cretica]|uniref:TraB family protein n=1 Tax=Brassica cretica TaxID=69181 RepID=A0ABQ7C6N5_BRACR|nr:hypothetical protein DY000_02001708 [Brassica cretica]
MEPTTSILLEPKAEAHVDDHSHNIVNVDKEEDEHSDSGSLITGVVSVGDASDDDDGDFAVETTKLELPEEYAESVMVLTCDSTAEGGSCHVYLIGTAHVSEIPTVPEMIDMWKKNHNAFGIAYGWFLAQACMLPRKLDVLPGAEFRVAYEEAHTYGGKVILGDRPVQITLKRMWAKMPLWHKVKFLYGLVFQPVFLPSTEELKKMLKAMNNVDMLTLVIQEMSKEFPSLMDTLVHERDKYMACMLSRVASEHSSVVAVIGRGHLQGIKKNWNQPIKMKDLLEIPKNESKYTVKYILKSLTVAVVGIAICSRFYLSTRS